MASREAVGRHRRGSMSVRARSGLPFDLHCSGGRWARAGQAEDAENRAMIQTVVATSPGDGRRMLDQGVDQRGKRTMLGQYSSRTEPHRARPTL